jgi:glycosyltransferase involved in cell wall biosynthesis
VKISVITASLNRKDFIRAAVQSVLDQRYSEFEHWIIDGGSSDGTLDLLKEYPHLKVVSEPDRGVYDAWNKGIDHSDGGIVSFLNSDDLYAPKAFEHCAETFRNFPDAWLVSGGCQIFCTTESGREVKMRDYRDPQRYRLSLRSATIGLPNINSRFFRRSIFSAIGAFDLNYPIAADREFLMRAALAKAKDVAIADVFYRYRHHPGSLTMNAGNRTMLRGIEDGLKMIEQVRTRYQLGQAELELIHRWQRELQATKVLALALMKDASSALTLAGATLRTNPFWLVTFFRCGSFAVARRIRTQCRIWFQRGARGSGKVRVLHLIDSLELGGAQTALLALLQFSDSSKFATRIASMHGSRRSLYYDRFRQAKIPVSMLSPFRWLPFYLIRLPFQLALGRYHVIHCHLFASNWLGKPLARLFGVPAIISHDHCNDALRVDFLPVRLVDRFANLFADRIFTVSPSIREFLVSREEIPPSKIRVIPNGVPETALSNSRKKTAKIIGGAGRLVAQKNFDRFLTIARELQNIDSCYRFVIAGAGPLSERLTRRANELDIQVEWLGVQTSLDRFFAQIDLYLLTSDFEGLPMTLLEALQQNIPAAAMAVDGVAETFTDEVLLIDPATDDREIAKRIHGMLQDTNALSAQIERGQKLVSERFSARSRMLEIEREYLALLKRREAPRMRIAKKNCTR